jgi:HSP20 family protein
MLMTTPMGFRSRNAFADLRRMHEQINRLAAGVESGPTTAGAFPPINVWVGEDSVVVTAEVPGVEAEDIDLSAREDVLSIRGKRVARVDVDKMSWHRRERAYGEFSRMVELPYRVDPDKVEARFENGVLEIELGRHEMDRPRKIQINAA